MRTLHSLAKEIEHAAAAKPEGLLRHENSAVLADPAARRHAPALARLDALKRWARSLPHTRWWDTFLRDSADTGFWHETYFVGDGIEAIYDDIPAPLGLLAFAPPQHQRPGPCSPLADAQDSEARNSQADEPRFQRTRVREGAAFPHGLGAGISLTAGPSGATAIVVGVDRRTGARCAS